jgi:replicative DNA helicase
MRGVASLAKELDVSVLLLSQLNRAVEARPDKHPVLSDLRQSGTIEEDARTVLMLYRPYYYDKTADEHILETMIAKDADGQPNMAVNLWCDLAHMEILDDPPAAKVDGKHYGREY